MGTKLLIATFMCAISCTVAARAQVQKADKPARGERCTHCGTLPVTTIEVPERPTANRPAVGVGDRHGGESGSSGASGGSTSPPSPIQTTPIDINTIGRSSIGGILPPLAPGQSYSPSQQRIKQQQEQERRERIVRNRETKAQQAHARYAEGYAMWKRGEISNSYLRQLWAEWTELEALAAQPVD